MRSVTWITSDLQNNIWISVDGQGLFCYDKQKKSLIKSVSCGESNLANVTHFWFNAGELWIARYEDNLYFSKIILLLTFLGMQMERKFLKGL